VAAADYAECVSLSQPITFAKANFRPARNAEFSEKRDRAVGKKSTERSQDLDLSQVRHLIHLANVNLTLGRDLESTQILLKLALEKMTLQNNPILLPLQKSLESDLGRLSAMASFNIESVILELDNINQRIQSTSIMPNLAFKPATVNPAAPKPDEKWYKRVLNSLSGLKELFIIRHVDQNVAPLISPQDERFLKENIQTKMLQAEWAVINQKPLIYQRSLKDVSTWVKQYFHDPKNVQPIMDSLAKLQSLNVKPNYPGLENSLRMLAALGQTPNPLDKKLPPAPVETPKIPSGNAVPEKAPGVSGVAI
jgi:uroporphyrin-3 C-methyltransferase